MIWCTQGSICILKQVDHSKFPIQIKTAGKLWRPFLWGLLSLFPKEMYFFGAGRKKLEKRGKITYVDLFVAQEWNTRESHQGHP